MIEAAGLVRADVEANGCVSWMRDRLPGDAIALTAESLPPDHKEVLGWVSDPRVAIHFFPSVVRRYGDVYWAGLPGKWIQLWAHGWTLTHWRAL